jgi:hypothetical protein
MNEFPYDKGYDPALPVCEITLIVNPTGQSVKLTAILDTGADATIGR